MITIVGLPMPPSENHMYATYRNGKGRFRCPSKKLKEYRNEFLLVSRLDYVKNIIHQAKPLLKDKKLFISYTFYFDHSRIYTKTGKPKRLDVANYVKAIQDELAKILEIDDCMIFYCEILKAESLEDKESVTVLIKEYT